MKKVFYALVSIMLLLTGSIQAQENRKELSKEERKALQIREDSLKHEAAIQAIDERSFTLEADEVIFKRGQRAYVNSNTNFVSVNGDRAVVQVAFNVPMSGPNGIGGVTVEGSISSYEVEKDKKGNVSLEMNVMGSGISARVYITMRPGNNNASVTILPNFNSNRLTLDGVLLPSELSNVFKGRSF